MEFLIILIDTVLIIMNKVHSTHTHTHPFLLLLLLLHLLLLSSIRPASLL
jgi:hypothetical protein